LLALKCEMYPQPSANVWKGGSISYIINLVHPS
jgi:hypothetical protein